jgi:hypothetical protein
MHHRPAQMAQHKPKYFLQHALGCRLHAARSTLPILASSTACVHGKHPPSRPTYCITSIPARAIGARRAREIFNAREATTFYSSERNQLLAGGAFQAGALDDANLFALDDDDASHTQLAQSGGGGLAIDA